MKFKRTIYSAIVILCLLFIISGCSAPMAMDDIAVMEPGQQIRLTNYYGTLTITAGNDNKRYITLSGKDKWGKKWQNDTSIVRLKPYRRKSGILDLRYKGHINKLCNQWEKKSGNTCYDYVKMYEANLYSDSLNKVWSITSRYYGEESDYAVTNEGLFVRWGCVHPEFWVIPKRSYIYIVLEQIYINGEKPKNVEGRGGEKIHTTRLSMQELAEFEKAAGK